MTSLLTSQLVQEALNICDQHITSLIVLTGREGGAIAVAWRGRTRDTDRELAKRSYNDNGTWKRSYNHIADSKLRITLESGLPSSYIQHCAPQFLDVEETPFWGSVILDGICVSFSGLPPEYDEAISHMVAATIIALLKLKRKHLVETMPEDASFLNMSAAV